MPFLFCKCLRRVTILFSMIGLIHVCLLPELMKRDVRNVVVIDVLRAASTIVYALWQGACGVHPVTSLREARELHGRFKHAGWLLGGERGGVRPKDFQLGNSPREYSPQMVGGKEIVFTTTNGTRALRYLPKAAKVLIGCFLNLEVVCRELSAASEIVIICSGTKGTIALEDVACAGAIVARLRHPGTRLNDEARLALASFQEYQGDLLRLGQDSSHARFLTEQGFKADVEFCLRLNSLPLVAWYDRGADMIRGRKATKGRD